MRVALGSDHRGYDLKRRIVSLLEKQQHDVLDLGCHLKENNDYPDYAFLVGSAVTQNRADLGILICGTGIGMSIAANKVVGVRAALCHDAITAEMSRRHNNANVLCLSADLLGEELVEQVVDIWLRTEFEQGRHLRRVDKITQFEQAVARELAKEAPGSGCR
jgi:ribose 5-phosphate isomerase B